MTTRTKNILTVTSLTFIVGLLFAFSGQRIPFTTGKTKYIVVKNAFFNRSNIYKPNAALLIADTKEIANNEKIFLDNKTYGHACGYHYAIQFWASPDDQIDDIPFNQECEEFLRSNSKIQSKMKSYIKQLETNPTHYIYNLQIPVTIEPKDILKSFDNSGLHLFFMDGVSNHYTTLGFTYLQVTPIKDLVDRSKWQGEQDDNAKNAINKINAIVDSIKTIATIIEQSEISFPMQSFGGGTIDHQGAISLKFKNGTDLIQVKEIIERNNGKVGSENNPQHYFIQLVDTSDNLDEIKGKLKNFKLVTGIYEYPQTKEIGGSVVK
jgi:hypothetical protein